MIPEHENYLRAVEYRYPAWIPVVVSLMPATWRKYREELEDVVVRHPRIFGKYERGSRGFDDVEGLYREGETTDEWGCVWRNIEQGLDSLCVGHPLERWDAFESYTPPEPTADSLPHGFMYMKLYYLRGFENFMMDLVDEPPQLQRMIDMVLAYNVRVVENMLKDARRVHSFGDDLGMQDRLPMRPDTWRRYLKPCFERIYAPVRASGAHVYMHTDGHILPIIRDLIECGVTILNPQIRANGLAGLEDECKDKVCIHLDLDRQLFPFCTPADIREHVREAVCTMGSKRGGLMLHAECEPDVPLENIEAICQAVEEHMDFFS